MTEPSPHQRSQFSRNRSVDDFQIVVSAGHQPTGTVTDQPGTIRQQIRRNRHPLSSVVFSMLAHSMLLFLLMLIAFGQPAEPLKISLQAEIDADPLTRNPHDAESETVQIDLPEESQSFLEMMSEDLAIDQENKIAESLNSVINSLAESETPSVSESETPVRPLQTLPTGGGLEGRQATARSRLAAMRGGSQASEMAVEQGLQWIIRHQREDGSWRFIHDQGRCQGQCGNPGTRESTTAATGLALLSLLGAGYTSKAGPYQREVAKGLEYLTSRVRYTSHGGTLAEGKDGMYSHAIATIALAEAFTMTRDTGLMNPIDEARRYIVSAQHSKGGWRYNPGYPGDMTVTGWQLMALKSCELAGFDTPRETWDKAEQFIDSLGTPSSGHFGYQNPDEKNPTTTAIGLLSKMYLGLPRDHGMLELGSSFVMDNGPSKTDVYFNYYGTQVLHHLQTEDWKTWNVEMRDFLINTQDRSAGHLAGSWHFEDKHGNVGGRLYSTAMAVMILEVYYRFMPLYEDKAVEAKDAAPMLR